MSIDGDLPEGSGNDGDFNHFAFIVNFGLFLGGAAGRAVVNLYQNLIAGGSNPDKALEDIQRSVQRGSLDIFRDRDK